MNSLVRTYKGIFQISIIKCSSLIFFILLSARKLVNFGLYGKNVGRKIKAKRFHEQNIALAIKMCYMKKFKSFF